MTSRFKGRHAPDHWYVYVCWKRGEGLFGVSTGYNGIPNGFFLSLFMSPHLKERRTPGGKHMMASLIRKKIAKHFQHQHHTHTLPYNFENGGRMVKRIKGALYCFKPLTVFPTTRRFYSASFWSSLASFISIQLTHLSFFGRSLRRGTKGAFSYIMNSKKRRRRFSFIIIGGTEGRASLVDWWQMWNFLGALFKRPPGTGGSSYV